MPRHLLTDRRAIHLDMANGTRKKFIIILNNESGTIVRLGVDNVAGTVRDELTAAGCKAEIHSVTGDEFSDAVTSAIKSDADVVVVGGGDGSVASAANICAEHGKPLGILPLGTLNLAARDVGMPLDLPEAVRALMWSGVSWIAGRWRKDENVTRIRAAEMEIDEKRRGTLAVMMDGELQRIQLPFTIKIKPRGLKVIAPENGSRGK